MNQTQSTSWSNQSKPPVNSTLWSDSTGPLIEYDGEMLYIEDLNPHVKTQWRMSRWDMFYLGWRCIRVAGKRL